MKYKGIIFFDFDDTIFDSTEFFNFSRRSALNAMIEEGLEADIEDAMKNIKIIYDKYGANYHNHYDRLLEDFYDLDKKEIAFYTAVAVKRYFEIKTNMNFCKDCKNILNLLKKDNYLLGIITKGIGVKQWDKILRLGVDKFFDRENVYISELDEFRKEENFYKEIFQKYSKKYDTKNIFMIGDRIDVDIEPAKKANFQTIHMQIGKYNNGKKLRTSKDSDFTFKNFKEFFVKYNDIF